ncbi:hypothetical protein F383_00090 [Gossypium arboreum]|uniref:Uncharacterized protein n=1 Tax=Gossypium arboreum TaxID=29729 RepID=A0A0B0NFG8_GOSAR|nr:hypothetical protein F383_00090 [Gossypium arboreum]
MFSKRVKLVDLLIKLKELKKENQARERRRSSSSRLGLFLPNTRFLGLVSFWVFVTVNEVCNTPYPRPFPESNTRC